MQGLLRLQNVCPECPRAAAMEGWANEYLHAPATVDVIVPQVSGGDVTYIVPRDSLLDLPRDVQLLQLGRNVSEGVLSNPDPLRCAGACVLSGLCDRRGFYDALSSVNDQNRAESHVRIRQHRTAALINEVRDLQPIAPSSDEQVLINFLDDAFGKQF